jgi:hypothetical protein
MPAAAERMYEFFGEKSNCYFVVDLKFTRLPSVFKPGRIAPYVLPNVSGKHGNV